MLEWLTGFLCTSTIKKDKGIAPMQIKFRNIRGSKVISFYHGNRQICKLYQSRFQPNLGYRLEMLKNITINEKGLIMSGSYETLKAFNDPNTGIDYVHHNFDNLIKEYQSGILNQ